jgi:hypothetical protein
MRPRELRIFWSLLASPVLGAIFGVAAAVATPSVGFSNEAVAGLTVGVVTGLVLSPAFAYGVRHGPWLAGMAVVAVPTLLTAYLTAAFIDWDLSPLVSLIASSVAYVAVSCTYGSFAAEWFAPPIHECRGCGYDCRGLGEIARCPECGTPSPVSSSSER